MKLILALLLASTCCCVASAANAYTPLSPDVPALRVPQTKVPRPPAPASFTAKQRRTWDYWTALHGFKSISIIQLSPAVFASNTITLNVGGKTYVAHGQPGRRYPSSPRWDNLTEEQVLRAGDKPIEPTGTVPGGVTWVTPSGDVMIYTDAGMASGSLRFPKDGMRLEFASQEGVNFLIEIDEAEARRIREVKP